MRQYIRTVGDLSNVDACRMATGSRRRCGAARLARALRQHRRPLCRRGVV